MLRQAASASSEAAWAAGAKPADTASVSNLERFIGPPRMKGRHYAAAPGGWYLPALVDRAVAKTQHSTESCWIVHSPVAIIRSAYPVTSRTTEAGTGAMSRG